MEDDYLGRSCARLSHHVSRWYANDVSDAAASVGVV